MVSLSDVEKGMCGDGFTTLTKDDIKRHNEYINSQEHKDYIRTLGLDEPDPDPDTEPFYILYPPKYEPEPFYILYPPKYPLKQTWKEWFIDLFSCFSCCKNRYPIAQEI
jgi:hypothetical protein